MKLTGSRCQCTVCKEFFNSTTAFDEHRKGPFKPLGQRYCDTSGLFKNSAGFWVTKLMTENIARKPQS